MTMTKFDICEGIEREIERLSKIIKAIDDKEISVNADNTDVSGRHRQTIKDCALELHRLKNGLEKLHVV